MYIHCMPLLHTHTHTHTHMIGTGVVGLSGQEDSGGVHCTDCGGQGCGGALCWPGTVMWGSVVREEKRKKEWGVVCGLLCCVEYRTSPVHHEPKKGRFPRGLLYRTTMNQKWKITSWPIVLCRDHEPKKETVLLVYYMYIHIYFICITTIQSSSIHVHVHVCDRICEDLNTVVSSVYMYVLNVQFTTLNIGNIINGWVTKHCSSLRVQ